MSVQSTGISKNRDSVDGTVKPLTVSIKSACQILGVGATTMWQLIRTGSVETIRVGRRRLVILASLENLVESAGEK
jgi:excisionase family DNA binding protein